MYQTYLWSLEVTVVIKESIPQEKIIIKLGKILAIKMVSKISPVFIV